MKYLPYCLLIISLLIATALQAQKKDKKNIEIRPLATFSKVTIEGHVAVFLNQSDKNEVQLKSNKKVNWDDFATTIKGDELHIYYKKNEINSPKFSILLAFTDLEKINIMGKATLVSNGVIRNEKLALHLEGMMKGKITVHTQDLNIHVEGTSRLMVSGQAENAQFKLEGMGRIDGSKLVTQYADTKVEGWGKTKIDVRKAYTASHEGIGSIQYSGNPPKKKINREGISIVRKR